MGNRAPFHSHMQNTATIMIPDMSVPRTGPDFHGKVTPPYNQSKLNQLGTVGKMKNAFYPDEGKYQKCTSQEVNIAPI